jgi:hypothetical protein
LYVHIVFSTCPSDEQNIRHFLSKNSHFIVLFPTGFGYANQKIVREVRTDTFALFLNIAIFDSHTSGELASRLNSGCGDSAGDLVSHMLWRMLVKPKTLVRLTHLSDLVLSILH